MCRGLHVLKRTPSQQRIEEFLSVQSKATLRALLSRIAAEHEIRLATLKTLSQEEIYCVPIELFSLRELSSLEIIVKHLRESYGLPHKRIAGLLERSLTTITTTWSAAPRKHPGKFPITESVLSIPILMLKDRRLSVLEHLVTYLAQFGLTNHQIAKILHRDDRTIWTVLHRARGKHA